MRCEPAAQQPSRRGPGGRPVRAAAPTPPHRHSHLRPQARARARRARARARCSSTASRPSTAPRCSELVWVGRLPPNVAHDMRCGCPPGRPVKVPGC
eukprot:scaffold865_cov65-Phaeocystis_antarctica.AAC.10